MLVAQGNYQQGQCGGDPDGGRGRHRCLDAEGEDEGNLDGLGEDIFDAERVFAQHVRVDAQRHGRVRVAEPGRLPHARDSGQEQGGRVQVPQIMQAGVRERLCRR